MDTQKKTLGKLKLNQLSKDELEKRQMKVLKGGCDPCYGDCRDGGGGTSVSESALHNDYTGYA